MVECRFDAGSRVLNCAFSGRMDAPTAAAAGGIIAGELEKIASAAPAAGLDGLSVVFDLAGTDYVSSAFLRLCLTVARRAGAGKFSAANSSPGVKKVFSMAGLDRALQVD